MFGDILDRIKRNFRHHRNVFFACMGFLFILNMWTSPGYLWVKWPFLGWGFGLVMQWISVVNRLKGPTKLQNEIDSEIEFMRRRNGGERIEEQTAEPFSSKDFMNSKGRDVEKTKTRKDSNS